MCDFVRVVGLIKRGLGGLLLTIFMVLPCAASGYSIEQQRANFLLAEKFLEQGNEQAFLSLSEGLTDYPLYPLLRYQYLKNNLVQTDSVLAFLTNYKDSRQANLLKPQWLDYLARQERWPEFIQNYESNDNTELLCQFNWANYQTGRQQESLGAAKQFWLTGDTLPKACDSLLFALTQSPLFTPGLMWQRFELAMAKDNVSLADSVRHLMSTQDQELADIWLQVNKKPELIAVEGFLNPAQIIHGRIFAHGVAKLIKANLELAMSLWDSKKPQFNLDQQITQQIERKLAMALASMRDGRAYYRLQQLGPIDPEVREWRVRTALFEQNWSHVAEALAALTAEEQQDPKWQYWQARTVEALGDAMQARVIYARVAEDRSFYGFLAADTINKPHQLSSKPVSVVDSQLNELLSLSDFKVIQELRVFNRDLEAQRQWWFTIKKLSQEQIMTAAKVAQQWRWDQVAIMTLVKANYWDDIELRFPVAYLPQVQENGYSQQLQPSIIFGLMRQESMLDKNAQSAVGARGLMQIMPQTGKQIARELSQQWLSDVSLFNPDTNIRYGTFYFKKLLTKFNGHFPLAIAAYNAGPNNVSKWLPFDKSVPADIWMETIPFKETRKYVASVLSYSMIYQQRLQGGALKIKELLWDVVPSKN
ncbi:MAG: transglycosylase SLT domain-containing protein [Methylococcaceae bacterium]|nr:transglycosylase SLT domain-containing protein [Methylococcaceae bacterium]MDP2393536.1 transglycosylase SLT domain-containing protein [Methylococcaceae bacterium]MDP3020768.1 transglycosylase SLT domain-containing protein [Methylococcaceae bacterium]MDZ4157948.1 transglycosylase SLT domain-containing protein [Methylococcales bacterium]